MRRAPFSPTKQNAETSLRERFASVDSNYSIPSRSPTPTSSQGYETSSGVSFHNNSQLSPRSPREDGESDSSSSCARPRSARTTDDSDTATQPFHIHDSVSEPGDDTLSMSPPSKRFSLQKSANAISRPAVNLSNGALRCSSGSSPFREGSFSHTKRFSRTKACNTRNPESDAVRAKLSFDAPLA